MSCGVLSCRRTLGSQGGLFWRGLARVPLLMTGREIVGVTILGLRAATNTNEVLDLTLHQCFLLSDMYAMAALGEASCPIVN